MVGLIGQIVLFASFAATIGLGVAAWAAGTAYGLVACAALSRGMRRSGSAALGPADHVTLVRAVLVGGVAALTVDSFDKHTPVIVLVGLAGVALVLDAVDGNVARSTGTTSALGARFDMEVDAFLILVLSVYIARPVGWWVLAIGLMRYAFVAASWLMPWLRDPLPARRWRKVVAATQGIVLTVAAAAALPAGLVTVAVGASLLLLIESFGRDVLWLWNRRPVVSVGQRELARAGAHRPRRAQPTGAAIR